MLRIPRIKLGRAVHIHVHTQDAAAKQAKPMTLGQAYDALLERILEAARKATAQAAFTKDEKEGHEFHGNQYVKVATKPTVADLKTKTFIGKLHELLSSGHPFTKAELMELTGIDKDATFAKMVAFLKTNNPKEFKGSAVVGLDIKKSKDGTYQVILPDGKPAPALTKANADTDVQMFIDDLNEALGVPKVPAQAEPEPEEEPDLAEMTAASDVLAYSISAHVKQLSGAPPGTMSPTEASAIYQKGLDLAQARMIIDTHQALVMSGGDMDQAVIDMSQASVLIYKKDRQRLQAAWSQAVHGASNVKLTPQQLYHADKLLAQAIVDDLTAFPKPPEGSIAAHIVTWKENTAKEKAGMLEGSPTYKKPAAPSPAPSSAPTQPAVALKASPVEPKSYDALVPEGYSHEITDEELYHFTGTTDKLQKAMRAKGVNSVENKARVEQALRARLNGKPNWEALRKLTGLPSSGVGSLESRCVASWASSSGDGNTTSVALQVAVRDAFAMPADSVAMEPLTALKNHGYDENALFHSAFKNLAGSTHTLAEAEAASITRAAMQEFAHAQYEETQSMLSKMGIKELTLVRGMRIKTGEPHDCKLKLQPASSFTTSGKIANHFSGPTGTNFLVKVPASQILGSFHSGFGCTNEDELVVLAHHKLEAIAVHRSYADTISGAVTAAKKMRKAKKEGTA